jgi:acetyltransferase-like isoleucine patch superfamily enzyme
MKKILRRLLLKYRIWRLGSKAIFSGEALVNKNTVISSFRPEQVFLGNNVMVYGKLLLDEYGRIEIGENSSIREGCVFYCGNSIKIGKNVIFADNIIVSDTNHHPVSPHDRRLMVKSGWSTDLWKWKHAKSAPIIIEDNVWIGQYSRILKGVRIGENSIVASNSVVTHNVPSNSIVGGNPAKVIKENIDKLETTFR